MKYIYILLICSLTTYSMDNTSKKEIYKNFLKNEKEVVLDKLLKYKETKIDKESSFSEKLESRDMVLSELSNFLDKNYSSLDIDSQYDVVKTFSEEILPLLVN